MIASKKIFVVLGMPRSGTSVIARSVNTLGVNFGERLTPGDTLWNPTGFWEDQEISFYVNRAVLFALDFSWDSATYIEEERQRDIQLTSFKNLAISILDNRFQHTTSFGFKDPRTTKIIFFWQSVFSSMQLEEHYIISLRNPLSVALSLKKLRKFDIEIGFFLWLVQIMQAIQATINKNSIIVSYELLLNNPERECARLQKKFNLFPVKTNDHLIQNFLNINLDHYACSLADLKKHSAAKLIPLAVELYELLYQVSTDSIHLQGIQFLNAWNLIQEKYKAFYPFLVYVDSILKKNKHLERYFHSLKRSLLWKMIYPLRLLDDTMRGMRKSWHAKRTLKKPFGS